MLYMNRSGIYLQWFLSIFKVDPDSILDAIGRKPGIGEKNGPNTLLFEVSGQIDGVIDKMWTYTLNARQKGTGNKP